ncbi:MAG: hypothetical protein ACJATI_004154 [Halioglobus sp.]|jgi:hypothetical protein
MLKIDFFIMSIRKLLFVLLILGFGSLNISAQNVMQKRAKVEALNSALHFANESSHGMLIVHRMLENYNQDINKYVDLESFKINFYTNKDLPKNIFDDPENWFYDTSPYEWCDIAVESAKKTQYTNSDKVIKTLTTMKAILTDINQLRFDLDNAIIEKDLTDTILLNMVYAELERGVALYDNFYNLHKRLTSDVGAAFKSVRPTVAEVQFPKLYESMVKVYLSTKAILISIREKEDENLDKQMEFQETSVNAFKNLDLASFGSTRLTSRKVERIKANLEEQGKLSIASIKNFYNTAEVPEEYKQYGKFYYYYNSDLINKYNRYGNGIVFELNNMISYLDIPVLLFTELPHYFKVIYPKKLEKIAYLSASDSKITRLPIILKDREIQMSTRKIKVDSLKFEVALYDHMIEDGDVISLNFNGDWIVEELLLTSKQKKLKLMLNKEGKNYFILHANSVGKRPPNTMAVDYYYRGFKKQIILESDLNVSEMIEIEYVNE